MRQASREAGNESTMWNGEPMTKGVAVAAWLGAGADTAPGEGGASAVNSCTAMEGVEGMNLTTLPGGLDEDTVSGERVDFEGLIESLERDADFIIEMEGLRRGTVPQYRHERREVTCGCSILDRFPTVLRNEAVVRFEAGGHWTPARVKALTSWFQQLSKDEHLFGALRYGTVRVVDVQDGRLEFQAVPGFEGCLRRLFEERE